MNATLLITIAGLFIAFLIVLMFVVIVWGSNAIKKDKYTGTLDRLLSEIDASEQRLDAVNVEIEKKQQDRELVNRLAAEASELTERIAGLRAELTNMDGQRAELQELDRERITAVETHAEAIRAVKEAEMQLSAIRDEIARGHNLEHEIPELERRVAELRTELAELQDRADEARRLQSEINELRRRLEEKILAIAQREVEMERMLSARNVEEDRLATIRGERAAAETAMATARNELGDVSGTLASRREVVAQMDDQRAKLEARVALLKNKIRKGDDGASDALADLKVAAPALLKLRGEVGDDLTEIELLQNVSAYLDGMGLQYHDRVIKAFHTALKVNDSTQMTVLAGISGTGKSQLPRQYAEGAGIGFLPVPVQPRWDSPQDLMGFYNYIEERYRATDLARVMWEMDRFQEGANTVLGDRMMLVLLDEMNLSRVEYYFSDFLSRLESRPPRGKLKDPGSRRDSEIVLDVPTGDQPQIRIFPGFNVMFAGTMNEDESTQTLSDKVVDRANLLRFASPTVRLEKKKNSKKAPDAAAPISRTLWESWHRNGRFLANDHDRIEQMIETLAGYMQQAQKPIGFRMRQAMLEYVCNYPVSEGQGHPILPALADQVEMRLLPKLRGAEIDPYRSAFDELTEYVRKDLDDSQLAEAISASVSASEDFGQFVWRGIGRT